jgi:hypothetical protein
MLVNPESYGIWLPIFILTFTQIQIMEAIIWTSIDSNNLDINQKTTRLLSFMLWLQPLMSILLAYNDSNESILLYGAAMYIMVIVFHYYRSRTDKFVSIVGENGHLEWNRFDKNGDEYTFVLGGEWAIVLYMIGIVVPFLYMKGRMKYISLVFFGGTFLLSLLKFKKEFGSMWCFYSVFASGMVLLAGKN